MDPLVKGWLNAMDLMVNTSGLHPTDEDKIIAGLKAFQKYNIPFDATDIADWARKKGWSDHVTSYVKAAAIDTLNGINKRIKYKEKVPTLETLQNWAEKFQ